MMRLLAFLGLSLPLLAACAGGGGGVKPSETAESGNEQVIPLVGSFQVHRYTLPNQLRLLVVEDHSSPTFAYQTWFRVGSRDEVPGRTGLAHLFEHLMFKGTKSHKEGDFDRILEAAGVEGENAFTSRDYTAYIQELPKDKLELIAQLEADRMENLLVNEKSFRTELEVVQNERRYRNENSPDGLMYQELFGVAFTKHPYHWPVVGYQQDLERMSASDAMKFYKAYYSPNHATVVVVGDVDPDQVFDIAKKYYGPLPATSAPEHTVPAEPAQESARSKTLKLNMQVQKLLMGYRIPKITAEDIPAIGVLRSILASGKSSRLSRALVDTGIASSVESYDLDDKDPTLLIIGVNLQKGKTATQAENIILRELQKLARQPVSEKELARAKNKLEFDFYEGLEGNSEKAGFLGRYEAIAGTFTYGIKLEEKTRAVTAEQVAKVTAAYLEPKNRSVILGVPK